MSIWTDFVNKASEKLQSGIENVAPIAGGEKPVDVGGTIFDAIYLYGRGRADTAVENLTSAFRKTKSGQQLERTATQQRIAELMPYIIGGAVILLGGFFLLRRR